MKIFIEGPGTQESPADVEPIRYLVLWPHLLNFDIAT